MADGAVKGSSVGFSQIVFYIWNIVARAGLLVVSEPVGAKGVLFLPFKKVEAVVDCLGYQFLQLPGREFAHFTLRMNLDTKEDFVLYDISYAGKDVLVEEGITDEGFGHFLQLPYGSFFIPMLIHHIGCPVVDVIRWGFEQADGTGIEIYLAIGKGEAEAGVAVLTLINSIRAKHEEVNTYGEVFKADEKMLAPALEINEFFALDKTQIEGLQVACGTQHLFAFKDLHGFFQDDNGGTFGHSRYLPKSYKFQAIQLSN